SLLGREGGALRVWQRERGARRGGGGGGGGGEGEKCFPRRWSTPTAPRRAACRAARTPAPTTSASTSAAATTASATWCLDDSPRSSQGRSSRRSRRVAAGCTWPSG